MGNLTVVDYTPEVPTETVEAIESFKAQASAMLKDGSNATHLTTWSTSVTNGTTEITTDAKFTKGVLFVGGLVYDLGDETLVTLDNTGATTVINFVTPIEGEHDAVLIRLR